MNTSWSTYTKIKGKKKKESSMEELKINDESERLMSCVEFFSFGGYRMVSYMFYNIAMVLPTTTV